MSRARDTLRLLLFGDVGVGTELQVDAPDIVGLAMHQRRLAGVEARIEPEAALGRDVGRHPDVGDQELVLEGDAGKFQPEQIARGRARAVGGDQPVGVERVGPIVGGDGQPHMIVARGDADELVLPAQVDGVDLADAIAQSLLEIILLQIDEGRHLVPGLGQQVEREHEIVAEEDLAEFPGDALPDQRLADAEAVEDLQRALRPADAARALADAVGVVDEHDRHAAQAEIDGAGQAHRSGADHHHRPAHRRRAHPDRRNAGSRSCRRSCVR